MALEVN